MATIKINEQIAFLRKQKNMTQEDLAKSLGISNQAVSKWESAQSCPDIQLLPELARLFEVSIDELMGYKPPETQEDLTLKLRRKAESLPKGEDGSFTFHIAAALHSFLFSKRLPENDSWNWATDTAIQHTGSDIWDYSCLTTPQITTVRRGGAVFFSDNNALTITHSENARNLNRISSFLKTFSDSKTLKTATALYQLTMHNENCHASIGQISQTCELSEETVENCLQTHLYRYLTEIVEEETKYRFRGAYMNIIPLMSLFDMPD